MTVMTINGVCGADPQAKEINGKNYLQFSVAHRNGKEDTVWVRVLISNYGQDTTAIKQSARVVATGRPVFGCYEGKCTVTLWADRYEVQF